MRFAWKLDGPIDDAADEAAAAEAYGFDAVWVGDDGIASTAVAASLASSTIGLRVIIAATVGHDNPVELAEQVAVADLTLNGRLVLAVRPAVDAADRLGEVLDLLADCFGAHPFRHEGPVWPTPANLPANVFNLETRVRVTPPPAQLELPLWVQGTAGRAATTERALGVVFDAAETATDATAWWATTAAQPALARRMRRAAHWVAPMVAGELAVDAAVAELRAWQRAVDLDLVVAAAEMTSVAARHALMDAPMREVRPRVQLDRYPPGLEEHWAVSHTGGTSDG